MDSDVGSDCVEGYRGSREANPDRRTTAHGPKPSPSLTAIERIVRLGSDQLLGRRLVNLLLFRAQNFLFRRIYSPRPPGNSRLLNLGCGNIQFDGWVNADRVRVLYLLLKARSVARGTLKLPEWILDAACKWNCADNYWEGIFTEHVLEHLSYSDAVSALREAYRTLQPGKWIRIALPDLSLYVEFYLQKRMGGATDYWFNQQFAYGAEAISSLTQMHGHVSLWDAELLSAVLREIGFENIATVSFGSGTDTRLIKDKDSSRPESLYLEARKPPST